TRARWAPDRCRRSRERWRGPYATGPYTADEPARGDQVADALDVPGQRAVLGQRRHHLGDGRERVLERCGQWTACEIPRLAESDELVGESQLEQGQGVFEPPGGEQGVGLEVLLAGRTVEGMNRRGRGQ